MGKVPIHLPNIFPMVNFKKEPKVRTWYEEYALASRLKRKIYEGNGSTSIDLLNQTSKFEDHKQKLEFCQKQRLLDRESIDY